VNRFLSGLLSEGIILEKTVRKCTPTSSAIYLPLDLTGRKFRVVLIPIEQKRLQMLVRVANTENDIKVLVRLIEKITGKKIRTLLEENKEELLSMREEVKKSEALQGVERIERVREIKKEDNISLIKINTNNKNE
jgi:hypothetical protein